MWLQMQYIQQKCVGALLLLQLQLQYKMPMVVTQIIWVCQLAIVVRNVKCAVNTMWTSIRCKRICYDGSVSSKIMDSYVLNYTLPSSGVHLHTTHFLRPRWDYSRSGRNHFSLVNSNHICFYCLVHLPKFPAISKQEHHHCTLGGFLNSYSCVSLLAIDNSIQARDSWCNDFNKFGILDS